MPNDKQYRKRPSKKLSVPDDWDTLIETARNVLEARNVDTSTHRKGSDKLSESAVVEAALRWVAEQGKAANIEPTVNITPKRKEALLKLYRKFKQDGGGYEESGAWWYGDIGSSLINALRTARFAEIEPGTVDHKINRVARITKKGIDYVEAKLKDEI